MISSRKLFCAALCTALLVPALTPMSAEAGIGGGIGITFPAGRSSSAPAKDNSYAGVRVGDLSEELFVTEKGGRLQLRLKVRNEGDALYMIEHPTGQNYDFALLDAKGRELWRWSDEVSFTEGYQTYTLEPGASEEFTAEIDRKAYQNLRARAVFVVTGLTDTNVFLSAEVPDTSAGGRRSPTLIHGGIIFGEWTRW